MREKEKKKKKEKETGRIHFPFSSHYKGQKYRNKGSNYIIKRKQNNIINIINK